MSDSNYEDRDAVELETLASLAENLVFRLPGCSDLMIRKTIQEVYRDFCRRTCCLQVRRLFKVHKGESKFPVPTMFGGVVDCVSGVWFSNRPIDGGLDYYVIPGNPPVISIGEWMVPTGDTPDDSLPELAVMAVEIPKIGSEVAPRWFVQKYGDAICSGVLAKLMMMAGRPWTDPNQSASEGIRYENAVGEARCRYHAKNDHGEIRIIDTGDLI